MGKRSAVSADCLGNIAGDGLNSSAIGLYDEVGDFTIQGIPNLHQSFQDTFLVTVLQQRPGSATPGTIKLLSDRREKVDDETTGAEVAAIVVVQYRSAAGGQHDALLLRQFINHFGFALAKPFLTFLFEDKCNIHAGAPLDFLVAVEEVEMQQSRKLATDSRLARAHRADEKQILRLFH